MALNLLMALAISAVAAVILTILFNYLYKSQVAMRLRARSKSTNNDEHDEFAWLMNNEAGNLLVHAALSREDVDPAAIPFYRQLGNAWNEKYPDSPVSLSGYSVKADQFARVTANVGGSIPDRRQTDRLPSPRSRGRHEIGEFARPIASDILGADAMPFLSP